MNVREIIDTVEATAGLLASQDGGDHRRATLRQLEGHLDDIREALGLPHDEAGCCGCGCEPLRRCPDCGGHFCEGCGDVQDGEFVCDVCREEREMAQEADGGDVDAGGGVQVTTPKYQAAGAGVAA